MHKKITNRSHTVRYKWEAIVPLGTIASGIFDFFFERLDFV